jgi:predicted nucleic acid-binding protein
MTVVVADTSLIDYPILIGESGVLQQFYHRVVIPERTGLFGQNI